MKRIAVLVLTILMLMPVSSASADKARFLVFDNDATYHANHLELHIGSEACKVSGNYITVRDMPDSKNAVGHIEQSDAFKLLTVDGTWAFVLVTFSASGSPDSYVGLSGWINADYVECPCTQEEYYNGEGHNYYIVAETTKSGVNLRELPSTRSTSLAQIGSGEQVDILSEYTGTSDQEVWYRVRWNSQMGFIRGDLLRIMETITVEPVSSPTTTAPIDEPTASTTAIPSATPDPYTPAATVQESAEGAWIAAYQQFVMNKSYLTTDEPYFPDMQGDQLPISFSLFFPDNSTVPLLLAYNGSDNDENAAYYLYSYNTGTINRIGSFHSYFTHFYTYPSNSPNLFVGHIQQSTYETLYYRSSNHQLTLEYISRLDLAAGNDSEILTDDMNLYAQSVATDGRYYLQLYSETEIASFPSWDSFVRTGFLKAALN